MMHETHCPKCNNKLKNLCPTCGKEMETYSRVVGYFRPVQRWNDGKQEEWKDRTPYKDVEKSRMDKLRPEED
tara:strand:- start:12078 stop:12293 length:216 start_codon:yes stop_codon:yes gene_type:complete